MKFLSVIRLIPSQIKLIFLTMATKNIESERFNRRKYFEYIFDMKMLYDLDILFSFIR